LALTFLLPVLGQLLVIPLVLAAGAGAGFWAWLSARRQKPEEVSEEAAPAAGVSET
jgi:flagellar basal body-associated protein FliL